MWRLGDSRAAAWVVRLRGLWLLHARGHHEASQEHPLYCYEIFRLPWTPSPTNKERCAKAGMRDARGADFAMGAGQRDQQQQPKRPRSAHEKGRDCLCAAAHLAAYGKPTGRRRGGPGTSIRPVRQSGDVSRHWGLEKPRRTPSATWGN